MNQIETERDAMAMSGVLLYPRMGAVTWAVALVVALVMSGPRAVAAEIQGGVQVFSTNPPIDQSDGQLIQNPVGSIDVSLQAGAGIVGGVGHAKVGLGWIQVNAFSDVLAGTALPDRIGYVDTTAGGQFTDELTITPANPALLNQPGTATFAVHVDGFVAKGDGASGVQAGVAIPFQSPGGVPVGFTLNNLAGGVFSTTIDETLEFTQDIVFGQPFLVRISMFGFARATADGTANFTSFAEVDLGNTLEWMGTLGVVDQFDQGVTDFVMSSTSGTDYLNPIVAPPETEPGAGDYNGDGRVDAGDYVRWRNHLGDADETNIQNSGDGGGVTIADYVFWKANYGKSYDSRGGGSLSAATPEPTTSVLALLTSAVLSVAYRRRINSEELCASGRPRRPCVEIQTSM
jgi:hypothetical protein